MHLLSAAYAAYNARDLDGLLTAVDEDVDWPEGTSRLRGKDAVARFWLAQWVFPATGGLPTVAS